MDAIPIDLRTALQDVGKGFLDHVGATVAEATADRVVLELDVEPLHLQPAGVLHGGVHCALVETAASIGGHVWLDGRGTVVGLSNRTDFLRPFAAGQLTATASPIDRGPAQQLWLVEITDSAGKAIARGEVRLHNLPMAD
jgi:uncharacterized protein (TIGR00369 family)